MENEIEEKSKVKNLFLLEKFLLRRNDAYISSSFLAIVDGLAYVVVEGLGLGDWATLVDVKGRGRHLNKNSFYEPIIFPIGIESDSNPKRMSCFLSWKKITDKEKIKKNQKSFNLIKMAFEPSGSINYFPFDLKFKLQKGGNVVELYNIRESLFLFDQSVIRHSIPCYFAKKEYYLDKDTFLFLRGLDFNSPANCWLPDNPEIPIKFTECNNKSSKTIAIMWAAKF